MSRLNVLEGEEWFEATPDGLVHIKRIVGKDGKPFEATSRITFEPHEAVGRLVPIDGGPNHGLLLRLGKGQQVTVPRADLALEADIARFLNAHGVRFDPTHLKLVRKYYSLADAAEVIAYTRNGWQKDGRFVVGEQILPDAGGGHVLQTEAVVSVFESRGDYLGWRQMVQSLATKKPGWVFGQLVGLSSPLLRIVGSSIGYTFNLTGRSSTGKTIALQASANLWGRPDAQGCLKSFNTTLNALEGLAESHSDVGLTLDEMKRGDPAVVREMAYSLSNGQGRSRMKSNGELQRRKHWHVNTLVSSEKTIEGMHDASDDTQAAGQVVRAIDVDGGPLLPDLPIDEVHEFERALLDCYGVAGPEFVRRLIRLGDDAVRALWTAAAKDLYAGSDNRISTLR